MLFRSLQCSKHQARPYASHGACTGTGSLRSVEHTNLPEVARVILVEQDPVVVLATSVTAATRVATVLADTAVAGGHVAALLAVVRQTGRLIADR